MKNKSLIWSVLGMVIFASAGSAQHAKDLGALNEVDALEHAWLKSQQTNNTEMLKPLMADTIAFTSTGGKLMTGKDAVIADANSVRWTRAEYTEMKITVYADTAIATAVFTGKGTDSAGKPVNVHERFTDTWVRSSPGQWRCVATHGSDVKN